MSTTATPPAPKKPAPPPPKANGSQSQSLPTGNDAFAIDDGVAVGPQRIVVYGTGGIGKSSLMASLSQIGMTGLTLDCEGGTHAIPVKRVKSDFLPNYTSVRNALHAKQLYDGIDVVCLDSMTKIQEMAKQHVIETVPHEKVKDKKITNIEDYGFGKGNSHILTHISLILGDLDQHIRAGRSAVVICHDVTANVPNPSGEDYLQHQPRLIQTKEYQIRSAVKEWADHLVFIGYDLFVEDGKATGGGSRCIYVNETPTHMAKSRYMKDSIVYEENDAAFWRAVFRKQ